MTSIFIFVFVLGILIFFHELGHFLAAKACGVYVDRFSLGMPPRIFGFKYGETDYCIGLLPIGGYVKMAGQEDAPLSEEERKSTYGHIGPERWFNNRPRYQRAFILVAGPAMNLVLGFVVYAIMAGVGGEVPVKQYGNRIGLVQKESPADKAKFYRISEVGEDIDLSGEPDAIGFKSGDRILSLNGDEVLGILDVFMEAILSQGDATRMDIEREEVDGTSARYATYIQSEIIGDEELPRFGVLPYDTALIGTIREGLPAASSGLEAGDKILWVDGEPVDVNSFLELIRGLEEKTTFELELERDGELVHASVTTHTRGNFEGVNDLAIVPELHTMLLLSRGATPPIRSSDAQFLQESGLATGDLVVSVADASGPVALRTIDGLSAEHALEVTIERPARGFGLLEKGGARTLSISAAQLIEGISGYAADSTPEFAYISEEFSQKSGLKRRDVIVEIDGQPATVALLKEIESTRLGETISIKVERPKIWWGLGQKASVFDAALTIRPLQEIGIAFREETVFHRAKPAEIIPEAWGRSVRTTVQIGATLKLLVTRKLQMKHLGGPVMIFDVTTTAARTNLPMFLEIFAMISINLCWFNLLPLPVLDGGQLVFIGIEAVRRKPVSVRVMETVQQIGLVLIIGLILFVTFNDVGRLVGRFLP